MSTTEKPKTAKAPAKPRKTPEKSAKTTTPAKTTAAPKATAAKATAKTAVPKTKAAPAAAKPTPASPTHYDIAILAEKYWAERGWQDGAAEQDWLRAEQELIKLAS
jgi:hypothetical protein